MKTSRLSTLALVLSCIIGLHGCAPKGASTGAASGTATAGPSTELLNNGGFNGTDGWWTAGATLAVDNQILIAQSQDLPAFQPAQERLETSADIGQRLGDRQSRCLRKLGSRNPAISARTEE